MKIGDRISIFMDRIGKGAVNGRVCIVLSEKYLKSAYFDKVTLAPGGRLGRLFCR